MRERGAKRPKHDERTRRPGAAKQRRRVPLDCKIFPAVADALHVCALNNPRACLGAEKPGRAPCSSALPAVASPPAQHAASVPFRSGVVVYFLRRAPLTLFRPPTTSRQIGCGRVGGRCPPPPRLPRAIGGGPLFWSREEQTGGSGGRGSARRERKPCCRAKRSESGRSLFLLHRRQLARQRHERRARGLKRRFSRQPRLARAWCARCRSARPTTALHMADECIDPSRRHPVIVYTDSLLVADSLDQWLPQWRAKGGTERPTRRSAGQRGPHPRDRRGHSGAGRCTSAMRPRTAAGPTAARRGSRITTRWRTVGRAGRPTTSRRRISRSPTATAIRALD